MHIEYDPTKTNSEIIKILCRSLNPTPIKEIADEIGKSYDQTKDHIEIMVKVGRTGIVITALPDGFHAAQIITGPHPVRFRKP
jgi:hypothetical protein